MIFRQLYVKGGQDCERNKDKVGYEKKKSKSKNRKTIECYSCKQTRHWNKDNLNKKQSSSNSTNTIPTKV